MKATPDCPTLLHYLAKVLLRSDPALVTFIDDMPHVEAAARGELCICALSVLYIEYLRSICSNRDAVCAVLGGRYEASERRNSTIAENAT